MNLIETTSCTAVRAFACPACRDSLRAVSDDVLECPAEGTSFRKADGVWQLLAPARAGRFERFIDEYDHIRHREGRGSRAPDYFRGLPYAGTSGRFRYDWHVRAVTYGYFVDRLLVSLEDEPLKILDLGAGNGWLSYRMAERGHEAWAVDLRTDDLDGLGAHVHYDVAFTPVQAEFDRLPFQRGWFDLVVFNASLHYSESYEDTLQEAARVLNDEGLIVIADSPLYTDQGSAERMVHARRAHFEEAYGFASDSIESEEYLTPKRLRQLSARLGLEWTWHEPRYGFRWTARRAIGRLRNGRESARFGLLVGRRSADRLPHAAAPNRILQSLARAAMRLRFHVAQRSRLNREVTEVAAGVRLRVPPGVFNPVLFRTGTFLAETVADDVLPVDASVLDLGTGTGLCGIAAARCGADVIAVDVNPQAVACAAANARRNHVRMDVREGNLFEGLGSFDVVLFNPPYFAGRPETPFEWAWQSNDLVDRFCRELRLHLNRGGFALVVLSTDGRCPDYLRRFEADGYRLVRVHERRFINETLSIYRVA